MPRLSGGKTWIFVLAAGIATWIVGCGHQARPYDAATLERKCDIEVGRELTPEELSCLARVAGLRVTKKCPLDVTPGAFGELNTPVWFVREGCRDIGIVVTHGGAIVGVEIGDAVAPPPPE